MAKRPGAGGIIMVAVILGIVTAYLIWHKLQELDAQSQKNWVPVVVAVADIKPHTTITREMVELRPTPPDQVAPDAMRDQGGRGQSVGDPHQSERPVARLRLCGRWQSDESRL